MYAKPFNPKLPFGEIFGDNRFAYEQNGQLYNAVKAPVDQNGNRMELEPAPVKAEPAPAAVTAAPPEDPEDDIPEDEKPFDLLAWATGEEDLQKTPWLKIRAEVARAMPDNAAAINSKEAARKAVLAMYKMI